MRAPQAPSVQCGLRALADQRNGPRRAQEGNRGRLSNPARPTLPGRRQHVGDGSLHVGRRSVRRVQQPRGQTERRYRGRPLAHEERPALVAAGAQAAGRHGSHVRAPSPECSSQGGIMVTGPRDIRRAMPTWNGSPEVAATRRINGSDEGSAENGIREAHSGSTRRLGRCCIRDAGPARLGVLAEHPARHRRPRIGHAACDAAHCSPTSRQTTAAASTKGMRTGGGRR